jgi:hypothetical protein
MMWARRFLHMKIAVGSGLPGGSVTSHSVCDPDAAVFIDLFVAATHPVLSKRFVERCPYVASIIC